MLRAKFMKLCKLKVNLVKLCKTNKEFLKIK